MPETDPNHCRCFSIDEDDIDNFEEQLENIGFNDEFQEDHGQVYGRILRLKDDLQLHVKVMPNGRIEAEMEPPPAYPFAHLNEEHSYSAHHELEQLFHEITIIPHKKRNPPSTCIRRIIKKPKDPTHAKTIAAVGIVGAGVAALLYYLSKRNNDDNAL